MNFKKLIANFVDFIGLRDEEENFVASYNDFDKLKVVKLWERQRDYYITRCINDFERLSEELATMDIQKILPDKEKVNHFFDELRKIERCR